MKNKIIKLAAWAVLAVFTFAACSPQEFDDYDLGEMANITQEQVTFTKAVSSENPNTVTFTNTSNITVPYAMTWDLGNGTISKAKEVSTTYRKAGTYTASLTITVASGVTVVKSETITIDKDDESYEDENSPSYLLSGGKTNLKGKVWRFKPETGAFGLGPVDSENNAWWAPSPEEIGPALYDDDMTFFGSGKFVMDNNGDSFMNESTAASFPDGDPAGSFTTTHYTPSANASWTVDTDGEGDWLTVTNGFIGYAVDPANLNGGKYKIFAISATEVQLTYYSGSNAWHFFLTSAPRVESPVIKNLTGGEDNVAGKTWVFDSNNKYLDEVKEATGKNIQGHMGLGPLGSYSSEWWGAEANAKSTWTLYDTKFTFKEGSKLTIVTKGEGYGRNACIEEGGFTAGSVDGDDAIFTYAGGDYTFMLDETNEYPKLTLSGNAFLGYYCGTQEYEIIYQTETVMALRVANATEEQDWVFIYCTEEAK